MASHRGCASRGFQPYLICGKQVARVDNPEEVRFAARLRERELLRNPSCKVLKRNSLNRSSSREGHG
jgi:hypothetical protein